MSNTMLIDFETAVITDHHDADSATLNYWQDDQWKWLSIYYQDGTLDDRKALITADKELAFKINEPAIIDPVWGTRKGRVQLDVPFEGERLLASKRMIVPSYMQAFANYTGPNPWFICEEFHIGYPWAGDVYAARISISLVPYQGNLYFAATGTYQNPEDRGKWPGTLWTAPIKAISIPLGEWFDLFTSYDSSGQFVLWIRKQYDDWRNLVGVNGPMSNPNATEPVQHMKYGACKLYTSGEVIDHSSVGLGWDNVVIQTDEL